MTVREVIRKLQEEARKQSDKGGLAKFLAELLDDFEESEMPVGSLVEVELAELSNFVIGARRVINAIEESAQVLGIPTSQLYYD